MLLYNYSHFLIEPIRFIIEEMQRKNWSPKFVAAPVLTSEVLDWDDDIKNFIVGTALNVLLISSVFFLKRFELDI